MNVRVILLDILSFCYIIVHNKMTSCMDDYHQFILDDSDGDWDSDGGVGGVGGGDDAGSGCLDTEWITEYETRLLLDEYELFLKSDIRRVSFQFIYLDREKKSVDCVLPMTGGPYMLQKPNQISQSEILRVIHTYQNHWMNRNKKYYNFQSLLLYDFQMPENDDNDVRWVSEYLSSSSSSSSSGDGVEYGRVIEYTNLLSFETIYFRPLIAMFHDLIEFTIVLYED
jgi:hypothetical protein